MTAPTRISIDVVCDRIESLPDWRPILARKLQPGDLIQLYLSDESSGFSDAEIARHMDRIEKCERLIQETREAMDGPCVRCLGVGIIVEPEYYENPCRKCGGGKTRRAAAEKKLTEMK